LTGKPERFESYVESLGSWFSIAVYSPGEEYFIAVFDNITERKRTEAALRESEERYRIIAESVSDAIIVIDQDSRIIRFANTSIETMLGYSPGELLGKEVTLLMPERYRDAHRVGVKRYVETGVKHLNWRATPVVGLHKSGKEIPLEVGYGEYAKGPQRYFVGVLRNVTELRRAEEALRLFRMLIDRSNDTIEVVDPETGRFLDVNDRGCRDLGYSREELLALSVVDIDPMLDQSSFTRAAAELRKSGTLLWEGVHRRKNGSTFPVEVNISYIQLDREYNVAVVRDITERQRAARELREARDRLQQAISAGNVGLWDWDLRTNHVYYSPEWKRQIGYADDEISEDFSEWQTRLHPEDLDRALQTIQAFLADPGPNFELEFRFRHRDDSYRHILSRGSVLRDNLGQPVRLLGSHVDITERIELQAQFLQAQKMESVGRLAGGVAHDFNNMLTVINGYAELTKMQLREGDPLREPLEKISRAGIRAASLTQRLLAFSRKLILQPKVLNLNGAVAEMQSMLQRLIGEDVSLEFVPGEDLGSVKADPGQMEQVLMNLAVNGRDAMPTGGMLTIATRNAELDEAHAKHHPSVVPGPHVMVSVTDTGVGMDEATQARIFEPFFTTKAEGQGTGLGLSTVYGIVKQSGGSIWVYSELGRGTTFKIYLPRVAEVPDEAPPVRSATLARGTETILIVEDDDALRDLAKRILRSAGYTVLTAGNGGEALLLLERHDGPLHLMFTDVVMPGMSGRDLAARLADLRPQMKVLYTSGYTDDAILRHGVLDEGTHFIHTQGGRPTTG
jgi:PAS domain S-box-containing protein